MKVRFWEESEGVQSMTRLAFALLIVVAVVIALYQTFKTGTFEIPQFVTIVTQACALKLVQKYQEIKSNSGSKADNAPSDASTVQ